MFFLTFNVFKLFVRLCKHCITFLLKISVLWLRYHTMCSKPNCNHHVSYCSSICYLVNADYTDNLLMHMHEARFSLQRPLNLQSRFPSRINLFESRGALWSNFDIATWGFQETTKILAETAVMFLSRLTLCITLFLAGNQIHEGRCLDYLLMLLYVM